MNHRKSPADLSASTFNNYKRNGKLPWSALFADSVQACMNPKLSDRAVRVWLLTQPILRMSDGYLMDGDEPMTIQGLAHKIWMEPAKLEADIGKLVKFDLLRKRDDGTIFDPVMVNDCNPENGQNLAKEVGGQIETYLNRQGSPSRDTISNLPQYSTKVVVGSRKGEPTTTSTTGTDRKTGIGAANAPDPIFGLTEKDLESVRVQYPALDFDKVYGKFVAHHSAKGTEKATRAMLAGWFKREKPAKESAGKTQNGQSANTANLPKLRYDRDKDAWFIGKKKIEYVDDFLENCRMMEDLSEAEAIEYVSECVDGDLAHCDWDIKTALVEFEDWLFVRNGDKWRGSDYETPEEIEEREEIERLAVEQKAKEEEAKNNAFATDEEWLNQITRRQTNHDLQRLPQVPDMEAMTKWVFENVEIDREEKGYTVARIHPRDLKHACAIAMIAIDLGKIIHLGADGYIGAKQLEWKKMNKKAA